MSEAVRDGGDPGNVYDSSGRSRGRVTSRPNPLMASTAAPAASDQVDIALRTAPAQQPAALASVCRLSCVAVSPYEPLSRRFAVVERQVPTGFLPLAHCCLYCVTGARGGDSDLCRELGCPAAPIYWLPGKRCDTLTWFEGLRMPFCSSLARGDHAAGGHQSEYARTHGYTRKQAGVPARTVRAGVPGGDGCRPESGRKATAEGRT